MKRPAGRAALVVLAAFALGVLTAYAQGWLPRQLGSLANSSGSWTLVAFLLALLASRPWSAALSGLAALAALLAGYVAGAGLRGFPSSPALVVFWGLAALLAGPLVGLGAHWTRTGRGDLAGLGAGGLSGVLVGEGVYGLAFIADTTSPAYWLGQIAVGACLLAGLAAWRLRRLRPVAIAAASCLAVAALFVLVYSGNLIALL